MADGSISNILVPTDLSEFGKIALQWGVRFRDLFGARITLLHVVDVYPPVAVIEIPEPAVLPNLAEVMANLEEALKRHATASVGDAAADIDLKVDQGLPAPVIHDTVKESGADLVIMGTHGRRGWRRLLLGSVTETVLVHAERPLLTLLATSLVPDIRKIVCPVNFTPIARKALDLASEIGQKFDAQLILVHVSEREGEPHPLPLDDHFEQWVNPIVRQRLQYSRVVRTGNVAEEVLRLAEEEKADLIVVGAEHRGFRDATVIGTTTSRVVRFADRPVLTVPAREGEA
ncbi:MAG TPA: universal stress protein [Thermoanaerobaculia bacterium]|nr:universal stress protein [Thermoanaerobaculia bacterium]